MPRRMYGLIVLLTGIAMAVWVITTTIHGGFHDYAGTMEMAWAVVVVAIFVGGGIL